MEQTVILVLINMQINKVKPIFGILNSNKTVNMGLFIVSHSCVLSLLLRSKKTECHKIPLKSGCEVKNRTK